MNNKIAFVLGLALGGAAGAVASWQLLKNKYKKIADEEIASMREVLSRRITEEPVAEEAPKKEPKKVEIPEEYIQITKKYTNGDELTMSPDQRPYVIDEDEFGDKDDYQAVTLTYYADGVLADFSDEPVENVDEVVGTDSLTHFGENENEPDSIYVRNDVLKTDYEILFDNEKFSNLIKARQQTDTEE